MESGAASNGWTHRNKTVETHHRQSTEWRNVSWGVPAASLDVRARQTTTDDWGRDESGDARYDWHSHTTERHAKISLRVLTTDVSQEILVTNSTRRVAHHLGDDRDRSRESHYALAAPGAAGAAGGWSMRERGDVDQCRAWIVGATSVTLHDAACLPTPNGLAWPAPAQDGFRAAGHDLLP